MFNNPKVICLHIVSNFCNIPNADTVIVITAHTPFIRSVLLGNCIIYRGSVCDSLKAFACRNE